MDRAQSVAVARGARSRCVVAVAAALCSSVSALSLRAEDGLVFGFSCAPLSSNEQAIVEARGRASLLGKGELVGELRIVCDAERGDVTVTFPAAWRRARQRGACR